VLGGDNADVRFTGLMRFRGEVRELFYSAFETPLRRELEAIGSEVVLRLLDPWHAWRGGIELQRGEESVPERFEVEKADSYRLELEDLARAIRGEGKPLLGRADAKGQAQALAAHVDRLRSPHSRGNEGYRSPRAPIRVPSSSGWFSCYKSLSHKLRACLPPHGLERRG